MDERINRSYGRRLSLLTKRDLPALADAVAMLIRHQGNASIHDTGSARFIRLSGNGANVLVRDQDWSKILPYLADGSLDPSLTPVSSKLSGVGLIRIDAAWVRLLDAPLRERLLDLFGRLFPRTYPTSNL